jgi:hypothetical protein
MVCAKRKILDTEVFNPEKAYITSMTSKKSSSWLFLYDIQKSFVI